MTRTLTKLAAVIALGLSSTACAPLFQAMMPKPSREIRFIAPDGATTAAASPPVDPTTVVVFLRGPTSHHHEEDLPAGVSVSTRDDDPAAPHGRVILEPSFPTADQPHRIVGSVVASSLQGDNKETLRQLLIDQAVAHGANAAIQVEWSRGIAIALLRLSSAAPEIHRPAVEETLKGIAADLATKKYKPSGAPQTLDLSDFQPLKISAKKGQCYAVAFALGPDAMLSPFARKALGYHLNDEAGRAGMFAPQLGYNLAFDFGSDMHILECPERDLPLTIDLWATRGSGLNQKRVHELGKGQITFQIYTLAISAKDLQGRASRREAAIEQARAHTQARRREICGQCAPHAAFCRDLHDCPDYERCLMGGAINVEDCSGE